ncbi:MAG: FtsX-like permease family protein [Chloroflexota bacterium]
MVRLAWRHLLATRVATLLAAVGLITASSGFLLLAGTSKTTEAVLSGDVSRAWSSPYQILVRPRGSATPLEQSAGLIRPNFLTGLHGGITPRQLAAVQGVSGVAASAPIAVAGFTEWQTYLPVDLAGVVGNQSPLQFVRVRVAASTADGSSYPATAWRFALYAPEGKVLEETAPNGSVRYLLSAPGFTIDCTAAADPQGPTPGLECIGGADPPASSSFGAGWPQPAVIAGVDPSAEAALVGLDDCLRSGRSLTSRDTVQNAEGQIPAIPVLASNRSYLDERLSVQVDAASADPAILEAGPVSLDGLQWRELPRLERTPNDAYQAYLGQLASGATFYNASSLWSVGPVTYRQVGLDHLGAATVPADPSVYQSQIVVGPGPIPDAVPPEARDTWFRSVTVHGQLRRSELFPKWNLVGTFDPGCLAGFHPLSGYRMEAYSAPAVQLPNGRSIGPTRNMAGYVNSPPLILTTLSGAAYLADPERFAGAPGDAFISAIRVRVAGVDQPSAASEAKLARVAADIESATGLQVDIVTGSSARAIQVDLPDGLFGRPAETVAEGWAVKGVAVRFVEALRTQDVAIFSIVLVIALILVAETAYISVRRRRTEFAVLRAMGWSAARIGVFVELEMLMLGLGAGLVGLMVSVPLARLIGAPLSSWQLAAVVPLTAALAAVAGLVPALSATRSSSLRIMRGTTAANPIRPTSVSRLALSDLAGVRRTELLLGVVGAALAAVLVGGVVLAARSFAGTLDATVLGTYLSVRVQPFHWLIAVLVSVVAVLGLAQIVALNYLERQSEFATLRALGWPRGAVAGYLGAQAGAIGAGAGLTAAAVVLGIGYASSAGLVLAASSAALAGLTAVGLSVASAGIPVLLAYRAAPAALLRGE